MEYEVIPAKTAEKDRVLDMNDFLSRINQMNKVMELPCNYKPTHQGRQRIAEFQRIMLDECSELAEILVHSSPTNDFEDEDLIGMADFLADIIVYATSEARRWGIDINAVLHAVMDSQDSKLVDGKPIPGDLPGKFGKGQDYKPPEEKIREVLFGSTETTTHGLDGYEDVTQIAKNIRREEANAELSEQVKQQPEEETEVLPTKVYQGHLCPYCKNPISDEGVRQVHTGFVDVGACPNCEGAFTVEEYYHAMNREGKSCGPMQLQLEKYSLCLE